MKEESESTCVLEKECVADNGVSGLTEVFQQEDVFGFSYVEQKKKGER